MAVVSLNKEKLIVPSQVVGLKKQDGKRIVKIFISDSSMNDNGDTIHKDSLDSIMQTGKDKPLIIPPFLDHPKVPNLSNDPQAHIRAIQEAGKPYEGGIIYDLERVSSEDNPGYNGLVELTSQFAINLFDEGILPRFYSMSIYKTNPKEPNNEIKSAVVNNICAVRNPAYGAKARILGMCVGDREGCKTELVESSKTEASNQLRELAKGKCDTMRAVEALPAEDVITFDNRLFNPEVNSSIINMSSADPGTSTSETTITYPQSGRVVKKDSSGKIISDTKIEEEKKVEEPKTEVKEEKTVEKEVVQKKLSEEKKPEEEPKEKGEGEDKQTKIEQKKEKEEQPTEQLQSNDRVGSLEQQVKQLSNRFDKANKTIEWYRRDMISTAISSANWLKPEQKEERINRYTEMDIAGEDLKLALTDAFGPQMAQVRANPERKSSEQYHEDTFTGSNDNQPKNDSTGKLTLDLLKRNIK